MAQITDQEAITFSNEQLRPIAEAARALKARCVDAKNKWSANTNRIAGLFVVNNADVLVDGRATQGVSQLTSLQINQMISQMDTIITLNDQIVQVPCVRPLIVTT